jgi:NAD(P)-dependent dehydrogenase (short-subunit alcohol dehydrogenase family)
MSESETAVIVGVGPGLGMALVRRFAEAGFRVAAAARNGPKLDGMIAEAGIDGAGGFACDAADPLSVSQLFEQVRSQFGPPDVCVFNAGTFQPGSVLEIDPLEFERCWRVGCFGGFLVGQAAAQYMVAHGGGTLLFTGATASLRGGARFANLAVPKFGLRALAQSMARELGPKNIHVAHVIIDGQIASERSAHLSEERGADSLLDPAAIAEAYYALHAQHRSAWTHELDLRPWVERF